MATVKHRPSLTEEEAQDLSEYVERLRPQDLGKGRSGPGARGRPPLTVGSTTHSPSIHVRLPESLYRRLSRRAGSRGTTVSEVVREILEEHAPRSRSSDSLRHRGNQ
jgi:hypothetical protein